MKILLSILIISLLINPLVQQSYEFVYFYGHNSGEYTGRRTITFPYNRIFKRNSESFRIRRLAGFIRYDKCIIKLDNDIFVKKERANINETPKVVDGIECKLFEELGQEGPGTELIIRVEIPDLNYAICHGTTDYIIENYLTVPKTFNLNTLVDSLSDLKSAIIGLKTETVKIIFVDNIGFQGSIYIEDNIVTINEKMDYSSNNEVIYTRPSNILGGFSETIDF